MNRKLNSILNFHNDQNPLMANDILDLLPNFPLHSMEDFQKFSDDLSKNKELRKQFVSSKLFLEITSFLLR